MDDFFNKSYRFELSLRLADSINRICNTSTCIQFYEKLQIKELEAYQKIFEDLERKLYEC